MKSLVTPKEVVGKIKGLLPTRTREDEFISIPIRYHVKIQTAQGGASQLAKDYKFNEEFTCPKCNSFITLDLMPDEAFIGSGHRFLAQFVCDNCSEMY